jgi:hypothetical protein
VSPAAPYRHISATAMNFSPASRCADLSGSRLCLSKHGTMAARSDAARRTLPMSPEELLEAAVLVYLRGLGLPAAKGADAI